MLNHTSFIKGSRKKKLTVLGDMSTKALSPPPPLCLNEHMRKKCVRRHTYKNNLKMSCITEQGGRQNTHIILLLIFHFPLFLLLPLIFLQWWHSQARATLLPRRGGTTHPLELRGIIHPLGPRGTIHPPELRDTLFQASTPWHPLPSCRLIVPLGYNTLRK